MIAGRGKGGGEGCWASLTCLKSDIVALISKFVGVGQARRLETQA